MFGLKAIRRNGAEFTVEGNISDGNVVILTADGKEHVCDRPNRLGLQYGTPWLMSSDEPREGSREWNIYPVDIMNQYNTGHYYRDNAFFVIGKWGTGYNEDEGVVDTVPLKDIVGFRQLKSTAPHEPGCSADRNHAGHCWITPARLATDLGMTKDNVIAMYKQWFDGLSAEELVNVGYHVGLSEADLFKMVHKFTGK